MYFCGGEGQFGGKRTVPGLLRANPLMKFRRLIPVPYIPGRELGRKPALCRVASQTELRVEVLVTSGVHGL